MKTSKSFYLPDEGNSITNTDIQKAILRITVHAKHFFSREKDLITILVGNNKIEVPYTRRETRSDLLHIGKDLVKKIGLRKNSILKFTKNPDGSFRIQNASEYFSIEETNEINYLQLIDLRKKYWESLKKISFPVPPTSGNPIDMLKYFKRKIDGKHSPIGPYKNISVFEAANRIGSDLIIINGIIQLIEQGKESQKSIITVRLGNTHEPNRGDFTINGKEGEAFNVASSFYKGKLRATQRKWVGQELSYILVNAEVFNELNESKMDARIHKVSEWDKEF